MKHSIIPTSFLALLWLILGLGACTNPSTPSAPITEAPEPIKIAIPEFNKDSAYQFVQQQVDFGPRVPETKQHKACADWIRAKFDQWGWATQFQEAVVNGFDANPLYIKNIIATINPEHDERILLCAHWDTRRMADQDIERKDEPILGADDGGSGVGILMEIARIVQQHPIDLGIDIVLFDAEDQGDSGDAVNNRQTWCIGSQHWSRQPHEMNVLPRFGILLDMVGSMSPKFYKEGVSLNRAAPIVNMVWKEAIELGYNNLFVDEASTDVIDDHLFINDIAGIKTIDIINRDTIWDRNGNPIRDQQGRLAGRFGHHWHTHHDNMTIINPHTLHAVGNVLLHVLYKNAAE